MRILERVGKLLVYDPETSDHHYNSDVWSQEVILL